MKPTVDQYNAYQAIFDFFNRNLFDGELPDVLLTFSRKTKTHGFFAPKRWKNVNETVSHEIALNPQTLTRDPILVISTLVHEQVHLWQQEKGKPSRTGYHNTEWSKKMELIGLMPSDTGLPDGKKTGQCMTHYIIEGGLYERKFKELPPEILLPLKSLEMEPEKKLTRNDKIKYSCPGCSTNVWGKAGLVIECKECDEIFEHQ